MTKEQISLLQAFKASQLRGSASMSSDARRKTALELVRMGLLRHHGIIGGSNFFIITDKGIKETDRHG